MPPLDRPWRSPVRARLVDRAQDWPWSSVHVHRSFSIDDGLTAKEAVLSRFPNFVALIAAGEDLAMPERPRNAESIGRPVGDDAFLDRLGHAAGRQLKPSKRGPKPKRTRL